MSDLFIKRAKSIEVRRLRKQGDACMFRYATKEGFREGDFSIYQGRNGGIYMAMSSVCTPLTAKQLIDLKIDVMGILDIDIDMYQEYYGI